MLHQPLKVYTCAQGWQWSHTEVRYASTVVVLQDHVGHVSITTAGTCRMRCSTALRAAPLVRCLLSALACIYLFSLYLSTLKELTSTAAAAEAEASSERDTSVFLYFGIDCDGAVPASNGQCLAAAGSQGLRLKQLTHSSDDPSLPQWQAQSE